MQLLPEQHFTQPPPRFTEASLVKELEEKGIGRPSTYAAILSTIQDKEYVEKKENRFYPTDLGKIVTELLLGAFPRVMDVQFTAKMEEDLDEVEEGKVDWVKLLGDFYRPFKKTLEAAESQMRDVKREEKPTDLKCEKCGSPMVIKWGRMGRFLACSDYPTCKTTRPITLKGVVCPEDGGGQLPHLRQAHGEQARPLRAIPRLQRLPHLQDDAAHHLEGRDLPRGRRRAGGAQEPLRQELLRLRELSQV